MFFTPYSVSVQAIFFNILYLMNAFIHRLSLWQATCWHNLLLQVNINDNHSYSSVFALFIMNLQMFFIADTS